MIASECKSKLDVRWWAYSYLEPISFDRNDESDGNHLLNIHKLLEIIAIACRLFFDIRVILCVRTNQFHGPVGNRVLMPVIRPEFVNCSDIPRKPKHIPLYHVTIPVGIQDKLCSYNRNSSIS